MNKEAFFASLQGKRVAFCGIGRSHLPLIDLFLAKGAVVSARDRRSMEALGSTGEALAAKGVCLHLGDGYLTGLDEEIIFRTPGMKYDLPELTEARARGAAITSEMELFFELCPCKIYAVTGSDGKTTTTTLISEMLKAAGKTVHLGGNIGRPLLPEIESIREEDVAVAELSSFQLISMRRGPDVAVVTNVSPNHLDVHKDMQEYIDAKKNILLHQSAFSRTVLNADNAVTAAFARETRGDTWLFSRQGAVERGAYMDENGDLFVQGEKLMNRREVRLPGLINVENLLAAACAVWGDVPVQVIRQVAATFAGVEHRAEYVRTLDGVEYYNDSIASSPTRTIRGTLSFYENKIVMISGGYDKHIPYDDLCSAICDKVRVQILLGATADKIEEAIHKAPNYAPGCPEILRASSMEEAVAMARAAARPGEIVSLSPASASFDMYKDFEARGRHFKEIVNGLK